MAVKVYNLQHHGAAAAYENEKLAYAALQALQGSTIPRLVRSGLQQDTSAPLIMTSFEGDALPEKGRVAQRLHKLLRQALKALHAAGAAHGDVRRANFVVRSDGAVRLVDLGQAVVNASSVQKAADQRRLQAMLE